MKSDIYNENDNVYLNIVFNHPFVTYPTGPTGQSYDETPSYAIYNVTKDLPIVDKASDYYCSVIRFTIPLDTIPIMIMPIIPNQGNNNLTPFRIGILYNGVYTSVNILYIQRHGYNTGPTQDQQVQVVTPYYFCYSYDVLISMINDSLQTAIINSGIQALFPGVRLAWFSLNDSTNLINLYVHHVFTDYPIPTPAVSTPIIYINAALKVYLDGFDYNFYGYNQPYGFEFAFILQSLTTTAPIINNVPTPDQAYALYNIPVSPPVYYIFIQEYQAIQAWSSLRKILVTTNTIPIVKEFEPPNFNSKVINTDGYSSGLVAGVPIITDFVPQINNIGESRSVAYYVPTSQYRLIDMISDNPIKKIDLNIYWQDKNGTIYPLDISVFEQASMKLAFIRKSLYKSKANTLLLK